MPSLASQQLLSSRPTPYHLWRHNSYCNHFQHLAIFGVTTVTVITSNTLPSLASQQLLSPRPSPCRPLASQQLLSSRPTRYHLWRHNSYYRHVQVLIVIGVTNSYYRHVQVLIVIGVTNSYYRHVQVLIVIGVTTVTIATSKSLSSLASQQLLSPRPTPYHLSCHDDQHRHVRVMISLWCHNVSR